MSNSPFASVVAYNVDDAAQVVQWNNSDGTYNSKCGGVGFEVFKDNANENDPVDASIFTAQLVTEPYSLSVEVTGGDNSKVGTELVKVWMFYTEF